MRAAGEKGVLKRLKLVELLHSSFLPPATGNTSQDMTRLSSYKRQDRQCTGQLKCDGTRAETRFRISAKRTSPFKSAGASVQSTTGRRGVRISDSNVGYTMFRGSVKGTGYPLHLPVSPSLPLPCVTVCHHIST